MLRPALVRLRGLDILRGVAVLLVLWRHAMLPATPIAAPIDFAARSLFHVGWTGVDLFFVLSGFLVSGLLFREYREAGAPSRARFWLRRGFKIYPAFYALIVVTWWSGECHFCPPSERPARLVHEVFYVQNYLGGLWNHTWSLAVEEHFYFGLPVLLALMARPGSDPFRRSWPLLPAIGIVVLLTRSAVIDAPEPTQSYLLLTHLRIDTLLWGVLLGYLYHFRDRAWLRALWRRRRSALAAVVVLLAPAWVWTLGESLPLVTWGLTTIALGFALLLACVVGAPTGSTSGRGPLAALATVVAAIGVDSYSIYLWHLPFKRWLVLPVVRGPLATPVSDPTMTYVIHVAIYFVVSVAGGIVLARLIERPMLMLRERWVP